MRDLTTEEHEISPSDLEISMATNDIKPTGAGKSSYDLINVDTVFNELDFPKGVSFRV